MKSALLAILIVGTVAASIYFFAPNEKASKEAMQGPLQTQEADQANPNLTGMMDQLKMLHNETDEEREAREAAYRGKLIFPEDIDGWIGYYSPKFKISFSYPSEGWKMTANQLGSPINESSFGLDNYNGTPTDYSDDAHIRFYIVDKYRPSESDFYKEEVIIAGQPAIRNHLQISVGHWGRDYYIPFPDNSGKYLLATATGDASKFYILDEILDTLAFNADQAPVSRD